MVLGLVGLACVGVRALGYDGRATGILRDPPELRRIILEATPVGTPIAQARRFLEGEGFRTTSGRCESGKILLSRQDGIRLLPFSLSTDWYVILIEQDGRVGDVQTGVYHVY